MQLQQFKTQLPTIATVLVALFFILVLHFRISYNLIPMLLSLLGIVLLYPQIKQRKWQLAQTDKWIIATFSLYFLLFVISLILHQSKIRELDLPARTLLLLPILAVCYKIQLKTIWILYAIVLGTITAAAIGMVQFFILKLPFLFPAMMYIQAGDILMSLSLFSLTSAFYFKQQQSKWFILALLATSLGIFTCLLNQARGAWVAAPFIVISLFVLNRHLLSKSVVVTLLIAAAIGAFFAGHLVQKRWSQAQQEITYYLEKNDGNTSVGARLDMWKSALIGIQEKPLFGWGLEGVKQLRKKHYEQRIISEYASQFTHAHNQYLHDANVRGLCGLAALLALFFVPLSIFFKKMRQERNNTQNHLWGSLGIIHILSTMGYCLTQAFFSHNSGMMFYIFCTLLFLGLQKNSLNPPLAGEQ
ncbi:hypothetical protein F544_16370 [Bibersteinia trehalosi USDA-ARS-USMARC-190]|uniref:O-antigen ligase-related domain-containing protein n=1 Tax=Bibersteinia trehalosi USDA-ARS-USMARC-190 TaxID=1263832 RepID=W0R986_BIBTR|nr:O-antigen ligase family protein [Bibersteinia trehalosi]AHG86865.1 hypothetical protein F544_16370 [Bibersteinia trehalosi USDA-ARS-USMARC-190]